jgi:hypothetical protein
LKGLKKNSNWWFCFIKKNSTQNFTSPQFQLFHNNLQTFLIFLSILHSYQLTLPSWEMIYNQPYITFLILQKIHTTIWIWKSLQKSIFLCFTKKKNSIRIMEKFHVLWKWSLNNKIKFVVYQKQNLWFSITKYLQLVLFPKTMCLKIPSFSPFLSFLDSLKSHHHNLKPTRIQNSNQRCTMSNPHPKRLVYPNHVIILPL